MREIDISEIHPDLEYLEAEEYLGVAPGPIGWNNMPPDFSSGTFRLGKAYFSHLLESRLNCPVCQVNSSTCPTCMGDSMSLGEFLLWQEGHTQVPLLRKKSFRNLREAVQAVAGMNEYDYKTEPGLFLIF